MELFVESNDINNNFEETLNMAAAHGWNNLFTYMVTTHRFTWNLSIR
jgi:hypothetical protein